VRVQAKRRPPSRHHMHQTTDAAQSFEDKPTLSQVDGTTVETGQLAGVDDFSHDSHSTLSTHVPVTRHPHVADGDVVRQFSAVDSATSHISKNHVQSAQHLSTDVASADNVRPHDSLSPDNSTRPMKPSSDFDDIFADSSLFASCKCVSCLCSCFYT